MATSWSFSKLGDFDKCKKYFWLKHEEKIPEPERPLPKGKTEHANDRGSRIHDNCEQYVRGDHDALCPEADKHFSTHIDFLRLLHTEGKVELEGEWGMDRDWNPAPWKSAWVRMKLDALVHGSPEEAVVIDYKTGKRFGNEIKHAEQTQLYALATVLRYPQLEVVHTELWYPDVKELVVTTYLRHQALRFQNTWNKKGNDLTSCTDWKPNPNQFSCKWCMYGPEHSGHCAVGVRKA